MYTINKRTIIDENKKQHVLYGIENEKVSYNELNSDKEKVENLCEVCNRLNVSLDELPYILDDFLNS